MAEISGSQQPKANIGLIAFAIVLATALWFFVTGEKETSVTVQVPVKVINLPPGVSLIEPSLPPVTMTLTGSRITLQRAQNNGLKVVLDCTGITADTVDFLSLEKMVKLPVGVQVTRVSPSTLRLNLLRSTGRVRENR